MLQKNKTYNIKNYIISFIITVVSSLAVIVSNGTYAASEAVKQRLSSRLAIMIWQIGSSFKKIDYPITLLIIVAFVGFLHLIPKIKKENIKWGVPFSLVAAVFLLLCDSYTKTDSWDRVFGSTTALVTSGLKGLGIATISFFVFDIINRINIEQADGKNDNCKKLFFKLFAIMAVCWIPYMIIISPGAMNPDIRDQFSQITGRSDLSWTISTIAREPGDILLNNHHPVFHTLLLGVFLKLGELVGSYFFGIELYSILQSLAFVASLIFLVIKLREYGMPKNLLKAVYVFFAIFPLFPLWGMTLMKDTLFTIAFTVVTVYLYECFKYPEKFNKKKYVILAVFILLLMLIRNNGFYLMLALLPFAVIHFRKDKKFLIKIVAVMLIPLMIFKIGYSGILFSSLGIRDGSPREMLSVPFQQTARYVKEYKDEITPEEEDAILTILGGNQKSLDDIAKTYTPDRSDAIKAFYNKFATTDDLVNYVKVWAVQLTKHPAVYVEAFLNLTYSWFCFESKWDIFYYNGITDKQISENFEGLKNPEALNFERSVVEQAINSCSKIPLVNCLFEFSFYTWIYVIAFIAMLIRKRHKELLACLPLFFNYAICFLGPVAYMRYALPMVVCTPFILFITFSGKRLKDRKNNNSEDNEIWIK